MDLLAGMFDEVSWLGVLETAVHVTLTLLLGWGALFIVRKMLDRTECRLKGKYAAEGEPPSEAGKRVETLLRLVRQGARLAVWTMLLLVVLKEMGVEIGPILAGAGIAGVALGFGAQNLVGEASKPFMLKLLEKRAADAT